MSSGVGVHEDCIKAFQELKLGKKLKYVIYTLSTDNKEIIVEKKSHSSDYDEYLAALPEDDCRWAVYDFEYNTNEGTRNKILFYAWSPDTSKIKRKMLFASSKEALKRSLPGLSGEIQGTDYTEVAFETVEKKIVGNKA